MPNEEIHDLNLSPNFIMGIKWRMMTWMGRVVRMKEMIIHFSRYVSWEEVPNLAHKHG
jgi:hypothetical protein